MSCGQQNNGSPKDAHFLITWTCDYVTLHGKRDFTDIIKLRIVRWGYIILDYPVEPNIITRVLLSERGRQEVRERFKDAMLLVLKIQEKAMNQGM